MAHLPMVLGRRSQLLLLLLVVVERRHRHKRKEMIRIWPGRGVQEMRRHRGAGEEVVSGGVRDGAGGATSRTTGSGGGNPLHAFEIETVLLQVTGHVFSGQTIDAHELHYGLGNGVFYAEVGDGVNEALMELRGPHKAGALEGSSGLLAGGSGAELAGVGKVVGGGLLRVGERGWVRRLLLWLLLRWVLLVLMMLRGVGVGGCVGVSDVESHG